MSKRKLYNNNAFTGGNAYDNYIIKPLENIYYGNRIDWLVIILLRQLPYDTGLISLLQMLCKRYNRAVSFYLSYNYNKMSLYENKQQAISNDKNIRKYDDKGYIIIPIQPRASLDILCMVLKQIPCDPHLIVLFLQLSKPYRNYVHYHLNYKCNSQLLLKNMTSFLTLNKFKEKYCINNNNKNGYYPYHYPVIYKWSRGNYDIDRYTGRPLLDSSIVFVTDLNKTGPGKITWIKPCSCYMLPLNGADYICINPNHIPFYTTTASLLRWDSIAHLMYNMDITEWLNEKKKKLVVIV